MPSRVDIIYNKALSILRREVDHIAKQAIANPLPKSSSTAIVAYVRLLKELSSMEARKRQQKAQKNKAKQAMSDKHLAAVAKVDEDV